MQTTLANKSFVGAKLQTLSQVSAAPRSRLPVCAVAAPPKLNTKRSEEVSRGTPSPNPFFRDYSTGGYTARHSS